LSYAPVKNLKEANAKDLHLFLWDWANGVQQLLSGDPSFRNWTVVAMDRPSFRTFTNSGRVCVQSVEAFSLFFHNCLSRILAFRVAGKFIGGRKFPSVDFNGCSGQFHYVIRSERRSNFGGMSFTASVRPTKPGHQHHGERRVAVGSFPVGTLAPRFRSCGNCGVTVMDVSSDAKRQAALKQAYDKDKTFVSNILCDYCF
jgi:hypothetical protein